MTDTSRGDVSLYLALIMLSVMLSSVLVFSIVLSRQLRLTEDATATERAFYAATSGLEQALFEVTHHAQNRVTIDTTIEYPPADSPQEAHYQVEAAVDGGGQACVLAKGTFRRSSRSLKLGPPGCSPT